MCSLFFVMQKNYIQFLVLALVAIGMVMIAGIRNDVNSLQSQVALSGRALVNKAPATTEEAAGRAVATTTYSLAEIENTVKRLGWAKQLDGSYGSGSPSSDLNYACPTCQGMGSGCCVVNGVGSANSSGSEGCWGSYGTTNYQGICSVARISSGSGSTSASAKTSTNTSTGGGTAEKLRACTRSETCPQGTACKGGFCVPCWGQGCVDGATRVAATNSSPILTSTLKRGMVSEQVTILQKMLVSLGYLSATPSGNFLSKTEIAVKMFQTGYGISPVSGIVGELTRAKLNSLCSIDSTTKVVTCSQ